MKLHDELILYQRVFTSDGAGGGTPGALTKIASPWGNVRPMSGFIALQFQQLTGSKGYEVWIRTDFDLKPDRGYIVTYSGIYGDLNLIIQDIDVYKHMTKLTCKSENKL
jgi:hypothetical protein